jgi:hypothetical protein
LRASRCFSRRLHRRKQHRDENADDRDDDQKFNEGKCGGERGGRPVASGQWPVVGGEIRGTGRATTGFPTIGLSAIIPMSSPRAFCFNKGSGHFIMPTTVEFEAELTGGHTLNLPPEIASSLPSRGKATVIVFVDMDPDDAAWRKAAYE